jgi:hypothetical protein
MFLCDKARHHQVLRAGSAHSAHRVRISASYVGVPFGAGEMGDELSELCAQYHMMAARNRLITASRLSVSCLPRE